MGKYDKALYCTKGGHWASPKDIVLGKLDRKMCRYHGMMVRTKLRRINGHKRDEVEELNRIYRKGVVLSKEIVLNEINVKWGIGGKKQ